MGKIRVTQIRSSNKRLARHKACLKGLGLRRIRHAVVVVDTPEIRGLINSVSYMVEIEQVI